MTYKRRLVTDSITKGSVTLAFSNKKVASATISTPEILSTSTVLVSISANPVNGNTTEDIIASDATVFVGNITNGSFTIYAKANKISHVIVDYIIASN